jgi:hypothetical protein
MSRFCNLIDLYPWSTKLPQLQEGNLIFDFIGNADDVTQYDQWIFYREHFSKLADGIKAVDFIFLEQDTCWLIEVKDYRIHPRTKLIDLAGETSIKVKDTIAGLFAAKINANVQSERQFAQSANRKSRIRVVLHLEQPKIPSKLFPKIVDEANIKSKLKGKMRSIDPHPIVMDMNSKLDSVSWEIN